MAEIDMGQFSSVEAARAAISSNHGGISDYDIPWWGNKQTEHMSNRGFVIGFRNVAARAQWRLDFDPEKKLHINWTQEHAGAATSKECYRIASIRPEATMWDYLVSWTKSRFEDIPEDIKTKLDRIGGTKRWNGRCWTAS